MWTENQFSFSCMRIELHAQHAHSNICAKKIPKTLQTLTTKVTPDQLLENINKAKQELNRRSDTQTPYDNHSRSTMIKYFQTGNRFVTTTL